MSKIQTILSLLLFLIILFTMDMMFGNHLRETFSNQSVGGNGIGIGVGSKLNDKPIFRKNTLSGNMIYSGSEFLGANPIYSYLKGDDQPSFFGFSF